MFHRSLKPDFQALLLNAVLIYPAQLGAPCHPLPHSKRAHLFSYSDQKPGHDSSTVLPGSHPTSTNLTASSFEVELQSNHFSSLL